MLAPRTACWIALAFAISGCTTDIEAKDKPARCPEAVAGVDFDPTSAASIQAAAKTAAPNAKALLNALGHDRRDALKQLLTKGADPNVCVLGMSLLAVSVASGDMEEVELLLDADANPDQPSDAAGGTPLLSALGLGRFDVAKLLLSRGAEPRRATAAGTTALHELSIAAVQAGSPHHTDQLHLAQELIERGVPVQAQSGMNRSTALMLASAAGNRDLVVLLLAKGADPAVRNSRGETASSLARRRQFTDIAELIEASKPITQPR